jgi:hypothetical protein
MILNARANSFYFNFPKGFFPGSVETKWISYLKKQPTPYDTITSFMNSTIQSVGFPGMSIDLVTQTKNLGKQISYQSATPVQDLFSRDFDVSFRIGEGFVNYFIMLETVLDKLAFQNDNIFIPVLPLRILDNEGNIITSVIFKEVNITSVSPLSLNYTANAPQVYTFSIGFKCNFLEIDLEVQKTN